MEKNKKQLFNNNADDNIENRRLFNGSSTNLNNFNKIKYEWTTNLYREMVASYWLPEIISLSDDRVYYRHNLGFEKKKAVNETLSFLIFLDSIQATALPNLSDYITAPEISRLLAIQTYQEINHSQTYSYILESICTPEEINDIYYLFKATPRLLDRCNQLVSFYDKFRENPSDENKAIMILTSLLLEGLLFYNGFYYFYALCYNGELTKLADEISLINRDEDCHLEIFTNIANEFQKENPNYITQNLVDSIAIPIVEIEIDWATQVYGHGTLGITKETIIDFCYYKVDLILSSIGFKSPFPKRKNPYRHLEEIGVDKGQVKTGLFEKRNTMYKFATTMQDWDKI